MSSEQLSMSPLLAVIVVGGLPLIAATVLLYFYQRERKRHSGR